MFGRPGVTDREVAATRAAVAAQLSTMRRLHLDPEAEHVVGSVVLTALDRRFVRRLGRTTGTATSPLTELEMVVDAICDHDSVMTDVPLISYDPAATVLGIPLGATIRLTIASVARLAEAVIAQVAAQSEGARAE